MSLFNRKDKDVRIGINAHRVEEASAAEMAAKFAPESGVVRAYAEGSERLHDTLAIAPEGAKAVKARSATKVGSMVSVITDALEKQCQTVVDAEEMRKAAEEHVRQSRVVMIASLHALAHMHGDQALTDDERKRAQDALSFAETLRGNV